MEDDRAPALAVEVSAEDEVQRLLGRTPMKIELSKRHTKALEAWAQEKGVTFQQLLDELGEDALRGYLAIRNPDNGQHR